MSTLNNGPYIVRDGLVLYLDAANTASYVSGSTTWYDLSKNNNNGTLTNGPTFSSANQGSIVFDGVNDNIQLGNASNIIQNTAAISCGAWVITTVINIYKKIFYTGAIGGGPSGISGIYFSIGPSPYNTYFGLNLNGSLADANSTTNISTTNYTYLMGTYDGSNIRLYINGTLSSTRPVTGNIGTSGIARISGYDNNNETWNGNISQVSIYKRALSAAEILQNYNATKGRYGL